jgi:hypothetical protein
VKLIKNAWGNVMPNIFVWSEICAKFRTKLSCFFNGKCCKTNRKQNNIPKAGVFVFPLDFASLGTPESMIYGESLPFDKLTKQVDSESSSSSLPSASRKPESFPPNSSAQMQTLPQPSPYATP